MSLIRPVLDIQVTRMYRFDEEGRPLRAFVDIIVNAALLIKGLRVVEGPNGLFVAMPQQKAKDGGWYPSVRCLTPEIKHQIKEIVLACYNGDNCESNCLTSSIPRREVPNSFNQWLVEKHKGNNS